MLSIRSMCLSTLLIAVPAFGQAAIEFAPRKPLTKQAVLEHPALPTGRLIVKFRDEVQARLRDGGVKSNAGTDMRDIDALSAQFGATFKPLFGNKSEQSLRVVEIRAAAYSSKMQPDLAGMMYVDGPAERLDAIAARLHQLNIVEFVEYDQEYVTKGGGPATCGEMGTEDCFTAHATPFCDDVDCCNLVCGIYEFCCDENFGEWDVFCADLANMFCGCTPPCHGGPGADRCNAPILNGGCFDAHDTAGCSNGDCCNLVCDLEPFCCLVQWDQLCVNIASDECDIDDLGATPDFTETNPDAAMRHQKYRTPGASAEFLAATGFTGEGFDMAGLWDLGEELISLGIGHQNLAHGRTIRVGVVEHAAYVPTQIANGHAQENAGHEDLAAVICEPGQTPFRMEQGILSANHGTACLGIIVGEDNAFGVTGLARHAQGYFFPIVSQESGGRIQAAIMSAIQTFEPGDVLSFSIGPGGCGMLASSATNWTLLRLAADLGITCCISAGNDCCNLDDAGQFGGEDSGCIVVGACWPGAPATPPAGMGPFCRLGFSNHCEECIDGEGNVHTSAWGIMVTTCGYGDLFGNANDPDRHYTSGFNGTSAACPQIAALIACLQGVAKMFYEMPLNPEQVRSTFSMYPQCLIPNPEINAPGSPQDPACGGDFDFEAEVNLIRGYPHVVDTAVNVFATPFFDEAPGVRDITVVLGTLISGNVFSIKSTDGNVFIVESKRRTGNNASGPGGQQLTYLGGGQITDIIVGALAQNPQASTLAGVNGTLALQATGPVLLVTELYNWSTGNFDRIGFTLLPTGGGEFAALPLTNFGQPLYVNQSTGRIEARLWTLGFTQGTKYRVLYDLINVEATNDVGPNPGIGQ